VSSRTWTPRAVASSAVAQRFDLWRAVEGQHVVATLALTDSLAEQHALERILDEGKPPVPPGAVRLHYLLFTPFRYPPPPGGSRFRGPTDPGAFYGADEVRAACAELGYWRWRHLNDTPALAAMPIRPQAVFRAKIAARTVDLRTAPFVRDRAVWTDPSSYAGCQRFGVVAREADVQAIRYESVRDPQKGGNCAVLAWTAFAQSLPSAA
jgi:RES domain